jgi:hypothetical protein
VSAGASLLGVKPLLGGDPKRKATPRVPRGVARSSSPLPQVRRAISTMTRIRVPTPIPMYIWLPPLLFSLRVIPENADTQSCGVNFGTRRGPALTRRWSPQESCPPGSRSGVRRAREGDHCVRCATCGTENAASARFCANSAGRLSPPFVAPPPERRTPPACDSAPTATAVSAESASTPPSAESASTPPRGRRRARVLSHTPAADHRSRGGRQCGRGVAHRGRTRAPGHASGWP